MTDHPGELKPPTRQHEAVMAAVLTSPTKHVPRLVTSRQARARMHGTSAVGRFKDRLALLITTGVGTMWAAYLFVLIALVSFPQALSALLAGDTVTGISWLSQSFLQLTLLPIIMVGQRVISEAQDLRAEADHETLTALHRINVQQLQILESLEAMRQRQN